MICKNVNEVRTCVDYLCEVMRERQLVEISVLNVDILDEVIKKSKSKTKSYNNFLYRLTHSVQGKELFEDIGIFYYPYICYKGCRVYKLKNPLE
ncbi:MAG: hypothetical protein WDA12_02930 [Bacilli bacterium]